ncbi:MAG: hypothetical protein HQ568_11160 [Calditrichaeota bacterium]|nr:hypothetical protein [Calditrichota bacterium]
MKQTDHYPKQKQRRGISDLQVELLIAFGVPYHAKGNAQLIELPRNFLQTVERAMRSRIIIGDDGEIITVEHIIKGNKRRRKDTSAASSPFSRWSE